MAKNEKINKTEIQPPKREEKNARGTPREESIHSVKTLRKELIKWNLKIWEQEDFSEKAGCSSGPKHRPGE